MSAQRRYPHSPAETDLDVAGAIGQRGDVPSQSHTAGRGYFPVDIVVLVYLLLTSALLLLSPLHGPERTPLTRIHLLLLVGIALLRFAPRKGPVVLRLVRHWYPLALLPFFYDGVQNLSRLVTSGYYDVTIVALEESIFGCNPSQELFRLLPVPALSEFLHFSYMSYIPLMLMVSLILYLARPREEFVRFATCIMTLFLFCYTVFIFLPVKGPFHHIGPIDPASKNALLAYAAQWMLDTSSSVGTAFPSSHVAVAFCIWMVTRRSLGRLSWIVLLLAIGILLGTVYGGFHYAVDALAGLAAGLAFGVLTPRLHQAIQRRQEAAGEHRRAIHAD